MSNPSERGFTLIELMLAMALFLTILLLSTVGFIGLNQTFARGQIRKQLSETSQTLNDNATSLLRTNGSGVAPYNSAVSGWNRICFPTARYVWPSGSDGGLFLRDGSCDTYSSGEPVNNDSQKELVSDNFKVHSLAVSALGNGLFNFQGVLRTPDDSALDGLTSPDPNSVTCKGTSSGNAVKRCAVEKFNFILSIRGGATL